VNKLGAFPSGRSSNDSDGSRRPTEDRLGDTPVHRLLCVGLSVGTGGRDRLSRQWQTRERGGL